MTFAELHLRLGELAISLLSDQLSGGLSEAARKRVMLELAEIRDSLPRDAGKEVA